MELYIANNIKSKNGKKLFLNPNTDLVEKIMKRVELRNGHCPCVAAETTDTICPCKDLRVYGKCHCQLYVELINE